jgi:hypothetical protein
MYSTVHVHHSMYMYMYRTLYTHVMAPVHVLSTVQCATYGKTGERFAYQTVTVLVYTVHVHLLHCIYLDTVFWQKYFICTCHSAISLKISLSPRANT